MTFEPITLVPMQLKMVEPSLLTEREVIKIVFLIKQDNIYIYKYVYSYEFLE